MHVNKIGLEHVQVATGNATMAAHRAALAVQVVIAALVAGMLVETNQNFNLRNIA